MEQLIRIGAEVNYGSSALWLATKNSQAGDAATVQLLLGYGADRKINDSVIASPMTIACWMRRHDVVELVPQHYCLTKLCVTRTNTIHVNHGVFPSVSFRRPYVTAIQQTSLVQKA